MNFNGAEPHVSIHHSYARCELVRPFPLGSFQNLIHENPALSSPRNSKELRAQLKDFYSNERLQRPNESAAEHVQLKTFLERVGDALIFSSKKSDKK